MAEELSAYEHLDRVHRALLSVADSPHIDPQIERLLRRIDTDLCDVLVKLSLQQ